MSKNQRFFYDGECEIFFRCGKTMGLSWWKIRQLIVFCFRWNHHPPHIHVYFQNDKAVVNIKTCEITVGSLPKKKERLVLAWVEIHQDELIADWELPSNGELPFKIEPLK